MTRGGYHCFGTLRFGLALLVVLQHFQHLLSPPARWPFRTLGLGVVAVGVFFVLSGFIVAEALATFYDGRPAAFLLNRLLRVVPPYVAAVALSVLAHALLSQAGLLQPWDYPAPANPLDPGLIGAAFLALIPGARDGQAFEFIPFVWSLRVETAFYIAAAIVAALTTNIADAGTRRGVAVGTLGAAMCGFLLSLFVRVPLILLDVPFFVLGVCMHASASMPRWSFRFGVGGLAVATCVALARLPQPAGRNAALQIMLLLPMLALMWRLARRSAVQAQLLRLDRQLGALSYPLYLNHYVVGLVLFDVSAERGTLIYLIAVGISLCIAACMHRFVEAPISRLRDHVRGVAV